MIEWKSFSLVFLNDKSIFSMKTIDETGSLKKLSILYHLHTDYYLFKFKLRIRIRVLIVELRLNPSPKRKNISVEYGALGKSKKVFFC